MGLDITYHSKIEPIDPPEGIGDEIWEWADENNAFQYFTLAGQEDRLDGVSEQWMVGNYSGSFRAGSYGGYNAWRAWLCKATLNVEPREVWSNPNRFEGKPFIELIDFADNEGCIGPKTSAKLAEDFMNSRSQLENHDSTDEHDMTLYDEWAKAFGVAAGSGCVEFG